MQFKYKLQNPIIASRKEESDNIRIKYPDRLPLIIERDPACKLRELDKPKFLVPNDITIQHLIFIIRKRLELPKDSSIFMMINGKVSMTGEKGIMEVFEKYKDVDDGYLYVAYTTELTWG